MKTGPESRLYLPSLAALTLLACANGVSSSSQHISLDGRAVVKEVGDRRVVVAVDSAKEGRPEDGLVDHVFLFTATGPIELGDDQDAGPAHLEFSGNTLVVTWKDQHPALEFAVEDGRTAGIPARQGSVRFEKGVGLSHYYGWDSFPMTDLEHIRPAEPCDHVPGSCYEANGHPLRFPR